MKQWIFLPLLTLLFNGCISTSAPVYQPVAPKTVSKPVAEAPLPPKKIHELKAVEDNNFSPEYMYPQTDQKKNRKSKQDLTETSLSTPSVSRDECIALIGQEKFDRYTQMLGGESGAIKRCTLLKAMK